MAVRSVTTVRQIDTAEIKSREDIEQLRQRLAGKPGVYFSSRIEFARVII